MLGGTPAIPADLPGAFHIQGGVCNELNGAAGCGAFGAPKGPGPVSKFRGLQA